MRLRTVGLLALAAALATSLAAAAQAPAAVRFTVLESQPIGRGYINAEGRLSSSFVREDGTVGTYAAPVELLYPRQRGRCSGIGVEDLANAAFFNFPLLHDDYWSFHFARLMLGDRFLTGRGVLYAAGVWDKKAVDRMGNGWIERAEDGLRIMTDLAAFLRDPQSVEVAGAREAFIPRGCAAQTLVGYGFSDSASLLRSYFVDGGSPSVFDAALIHAAGATCWDFAIGQAAKSCPRLARELGAKVISLDAETDVQVQGGATARQQLAEYRHYEIAGAAHLPKREFDLMQLAREADDENPAFATALRATSRFQNPEAMAPATRAAFHHLVKWARTGADPPASAHLAGSFDAFGQFQIARDADGNALGGIRLPWLETTLLSGARVGAALGFHDGVDPTGSLILGGRFECFDDIPSRHPSHAGYVRRVRDGAAFARAQGWILETDRRAYAREAAALDLANPGCPPWPDALTAPAAGGAERGRT